MLFLLELFELPDFVLLLPEFVVFDELGDELVAFELPLLLLFLELGAPDPPPDDDCFSFLSLIIIYTIATHLIIVSQTLSKCHYIRVSCYVAVAN